MDHFILLLNNILINNYKENNSIHNNLPKKIFAIQYLLILFSEIKEEAKQLKIIKIIINELNLQHKSNSIIYIQLIKILQNENKVHFISKHCLFELQTFLERKLAKICYFYNNLVFIHPLSFLIINNNNNTTTQNDSLEFTISENIGYVSSMLFCIEHCSSSSNIAKRLKEIIKDMNALEPLIYCCGSDDSSSKKSQISHSTDSTATASSFMASKSSTTTSNTKGKLSLQYSNYHGLLFIIQLRGRGSCLFSLLS